MGFSRWGSSKPTARGIVISQNVLMDGAFQATSQVVAQMTKSSCKTHRLPLAAVAEERGSVRGVQEVAGVAREWSPGNAGRPPRHTLSFTLSTPSVPTHGGLSRHTHRVFRHTKGSVRFHRGLCRPLQPSPRDGSRRRHYHHWGESPRDGWVLKEDLVNLRGHLKSTVNSYILRDENTSCGRVCRKQRSP